jgi:hypothetical protein
VSPHLFGMGVVLSNVCSGQASFDMKRMEVLVDNTDAFAIHSMESGSCVSVFSTGRPTRRVPKQAVFTDDGETIVVGSDHGDVYVFDREGGHHTAVLEHARSGSTQTIAVSHCYITHTA